MSSIIKTQQNKPKAADRADRIIDRIEHLPPAPTIATQLLDHFKSEENPDVDRIVELIRQDPSLTGEVLTAHATSAYFGGEPVSDMFQAVTRVGFYEVYCMVMSMLALQTLELARASGNKEIGVLWRHSVISAVAAEALAWYAGDDEGDGIRCTGLLHDVGKLIIISAESALCRANRKRGGAERPAIPGNGEIDAGGHARGGRRAPFGALGPAGGYYDRGAEASRPAGQAVSVERLTAIVKVSDTLAHRRPLFGDPARNRF